MKFKVIGANRATGEDRETVIEAVDADAARASANAQGILVSSCDPVADVASSEATKSCPFCAETINAKAIKCRWCGEMLDRASSVTTPPPLRQPPMLPKVQSVPAPSVPAAKLPGQVAGANAVNRSADKKSVVPAPPNAVAGCLGGLVTLGVIVMIVVWLFSGGDDSGASLPLSSTTFVDFDSKFCIHSRLTNLQKNREIDSFKGKRVRWEGVVSYVSDDSVGITHKATTSTYDVLLTVSKKERSSLASLNDGDLVTYEGTINDYGTILPHGLKDGRIVSHTPMSAGDKLIFLAKTETAVMNRIGGASPGD